jgi:8-oxo-dGTP diphosphatase
MNPQKFCYEYPRPAVTTDCVIFSFIHEKLNVLLIQRKGEPFKDKWALPGGFMNMDETAEDCAKRELLEETGIENAVLEQFHTFTAVDRDTRGRTISIAFFALVDANSSTLKAGDDAANAGWFSLGNIPPLAFDHGRVLGMATERLTERLKK